MKKSFPKRFYLLFAFSSLLQFAFGQNQTSTCPIEVLFFGNQVCNDNGTPGDPSDDTYTLDLVVNLNGGTSWTTTAPNIFTGGYNVLTTIGPFPASLGLSFIMIDDDNPGCWTIFIWDPVCPDNGDCNIFSAVPNFLCDDNGTPNNPNDDFYDWTFFISGINYGSGWSTIGDPNNNSGAYGVTHLLGSYPANTPFSFQIIDNDNPSCTFMVGAGAFPHCSNGSSCAISTTTGNILCDDNGTPSNPADDTFTFEVLVSGLNTGSGWSANDPNATSGSYDVTTVMGPYLISNGPISPIITDNDDNSCTTTFTVNPPLPCSVACAISANSTNVICNNNGTPTDPADDTFTFDILVTGTNTGIGWSAGTVSGSYNMITSFGPYPISGGMIVLNIQDDDDPSCSTSVPVSPPNTCSDQCVISASLSNFFCHNNFTPNDPSDDLFTVDIVVTGSNMGTTWISGISSAPNNYNTIITIGPFLIVNGPLTLTISDTADPSCQTTITIDPPAPCSNGCLMTASESNILCDDNGTASDPSDDTFTFDILVTGLTSPSGWMAGGVSGAYDVPANFGPYPISGGPVVLNIADIDDPACFTTITIAPPPSCSFDCNIVVTTSNIVCHDNGTPADSNDDTFTFDILVTGSNTGVSWTAGGLSGAYDLLTNVGPYPISGGTVTLNIQDIDDPNCQTNTSVNPPMTCSENCVLTATSSNILCNNNGTPSDPIDDFFTFDVLVTGVNTGAGWTAGSVSGSYDVVTSFGPYLINAGIVNITIQDNTDSGCQTNINIAPPLSCSNDCAITASSSNILCDDNGTPSDPADDTFTFDILVTGSNTGTGWTAGAVSGNYGVASSFGPFPIGAGTVNITIEDDADANCQSSIDIDPPMPCSGACSIAASSSNILCDDNGTPSDPADDTFTFDILVTGSNTGTGWTAGAVSGNYGVAASFGPFPISAGTVNITVEDDADVNCQSSIDIDPPMPCSGTCSIAASSSNILCDDNGTPSDPADDTFTFDILVTGSNTGTGWTAGAVSGNYGVASTFGPFPISAGTVNITVEDDADANCQSSINIDPPMPCSGNCSIAASGSNILCDDNGTPSDPADDTFTFDILVTGSNTGTGWTAGAVSGNYGVASTFGPFPISAGTVNITIEDNADVNCQSSINIDPPSSCSGTCLLAASYFDISCSDNGTPTDPNDDTFNFEVFVSGINAGTGWTAGSESGAYLTPINLGPYPISGGIVNINFADSTDPSCTTSITVDPPASCSSTCLISTSSSNLICDDNGTPSDSTDDTFTFDLTVTGINTGTGWTAGSVSGAYGVPTSFGPYPISIGTINILVAGNIDFNCQTSISVDPPMTCSGTCLITANSANILCNDNGTPSDASDDSFSFDLLVTGVNMGTNWISGSTAGTYDVPTSFGFYPINGGAVNLNIQDNADPNCSTLINVNPPATCSPCIETVEAGFGGVVSCTNPFVELIATASINGDYSWTGPNGFVQNNTLTTSVNEAGIYYFTMNYSANCSAVDSVEVMADNTIPVAQGGPDTILTCAITEIWLEGSLTAEQNGFWYNGSFVLMGNGASIFITAPGTYYFQIEDMDSGCPSSFDEVIVMDGTAIPAAVIYADPNDFLDCIINSVELSVIPEINVVYSWDVNGEIILANNITVSEPGIYGLLAVDTLTGCSGSDQIIINDFEDYPLINLNPATTISCNNPISLIDATGSQSGSNITYTWLDEGFIPIPNANDNTLSVSSGGTYYLQLIDDITGCENIDTIFIPSLLDLPIASVANDLALPCLETQTTLNLELSDPISTVNINWNTLEGNIVSGELTTAPIVNGTGFYFVTIQNITSGCSIEDSILVSNNPNVPETATLIAENESCFGLGNGLAQINAVSGGTSPFVYTLNGNQSNDNGSFSNLTPGNYALNIMDNEGCALDTSFTIAEGIDLELSLPPTLSLAFDEIGTVDGITNVDEGDLVLIQWSPAELVSCDNCLSTSLLANEDQEYTLTIAHENGCAAIATIRVAVKPEISVYVPNAFSPNDDGKNDFFTIYSNEEIQEIEELIIADRWGEIVFKNVNFAPNNPALGWDGRFRGDKMNAAVFVYYFTVELPNGTKKVFSGDLSLIR